MKLFHKIPLFFERWLPLVFLFFTSWSFWFVNISPLPHNHCTLLVFLLFTSWPFWSVSISLNNAIIAICIYLFISDNMVSFVCRANIALCWCFCYCHFGLYCQAPQLHRESIFKVCSAKCVHFCAKLTFVNLTLPSFWHLSHSAAKPGHHNQQVNLLSKLHFVLWRSLQLRVNPPESENWKVKLHMFWEYVLLKRLQSRISQM